MNKILIIIQREYLTRVRKKSFIIMTLLGPLLLGGILAGVFLINKADTEKHTIVIIDKSNIFKGKFKDTDRLTFLYLDEDLDSVKLKTKREGYFGVLYIPPLTTNIASIEKGAIFYSETQPGFAILQPIKSTIEKEVKGQKFRDEGIDDKKLMAIQTDVQIQTRNLEDKKTNTGLVTGLGFGGGLLIYMFIFIYGVLVMRGVMEEKTSRIMEVIISSVKPFQLMMGKIIGVALVGLTQFLLWVILSAVVITGVTSGFMSGKTDKEKIEQMSRISGKVQSDGVSTPDVMKTKGEQIKDVLGTINFPTIIAAFIFFFLGGYFLYSALFAAIGSAVDAETDTQQFMLPVSLPLILAYIVSTTVMGNPNGSVAFWFSMIPFTSPIIMMLRIPFGVDYWQVYLSGFLLILGFIFTTWLAAKIYRTGVLMYGKKISYGELWKWLRYRN